MGREGGGAGGGEGRVVLGRIQFSTVVRGIFQEAFKSLKSRPYTDIPGSLFLILQPKIGQRRHAQVSEEPCKGNSFTRLMKSFSNVDILACQ